MNPCETSMSVAALANAIACKLSTTEEISALAAIFIQLGYTMETIAGQQELHTSRKENKCKQSP